LGCITDRYDGTTRQDQKNNDTYDEGLLPHGFNIQ